MKPNGGARDLNGTKKVGTANQVKRSETSAKLQVKSEIKVSV